MKGTFLTFLLLITFFCAQAQETMDSLDLKKPENPRLNEFLITGIVEFNWPQLDYAERFNPHPGIGLGFYWKSKNDIYLGADFTAYFADNIKETGVISNLLTSSGYVIGGNGQAAEITISQRGYNLNFLKVGKLLLQSGLINGNIHSGIVGMIGFGLLQHKIRIVDQSGSVPGLTKDYLKGYDKLSNGFSLSPSIGYAYYDRKKYVNFLLSVEYRMAWTKNRRDWNHVDMEKDETLRMDNSWIFRLSWYFPIRKKRSKDYYYF